MQSSTNSQGQTQFLRVRFLRAIIQGPLTRTSRERKVGSGRWSVLSIPGPLLQTPLRRACTPPGSIFIA